MLAKLRADCFCNGPAQQRGVSCSTESLPPPDTLEGVSSALPALSGSIHNFWFCVCPPFTPEDPTFKLHSDFSVSVIVSRKRLIIPFTRLLTPERYFGIYDLPSQHRLGKKKIMHIGGERRNAHIVILKWNLRRTGRVVGAPHGSSNLDSDLSPPRWEFSWDIAFKYCYLRCGLSQQVEWGGTVCFTAHQYSC